MRSNHERTNTPIVFSRLFQLKYDIHMPYVHSVFELLAKLSIDYRTYGLRTFYCDLIPKCHRLIRTDKLSHRNNQEVKLKNYVILRIITLLNIIFR